MRTFAGRSRSGFTLTELMVAVSLAVIIMTIVVIVFGQATGVFRQAHARTEAIHSARVALDMLEGDVRAAYLEPGGAIFLGVPDDTYGGVDNDGSGSAADDPEDFQNTPGEERHGLELLAMSLYATDNAGESIPAQHVLYYLTRDEISSGGRQMGRLIRCTWDALDTGPLIGRPAPAGLTGRQLEEQEAVALGVTQLKFAYFYDGQWYEGWNSTATGGFDGSTHQFQHRRLPEVLRVELTVVDVDGVLDKADSNPVVVSRLIAVQ